MSNLLNVKQREVKSRKLMVGLGEYTCVVINPTKDQLVELLGTENINEPNYINNGKTRLDFWLKNDDILSKMSIWLENKTRVAKSGNILFINEKNQSTWSSSLQELAGKPSMAWFDLTTARECKVGEDTLYDFIVAYINADTKEGGIVLQSLDKIMNGDVSELTNLIDHYNNSANRSIKLLTGVRDNRQEFYTKFFMRKENRSIRALMTKLEDNPFNAEYILEGYEEYDPQKMISTEKLDTNKTEGESTSLF